MGGFGDFGGGSLEAYKDLRANEEAMAVINSMVIRAEIEYFSDATVTLTGYATHAQLAPLYTRFQQDQNLSALTSDIAALVQQNSMFNNNVTTYWNQYYGGGQ